MRFTNARFLTISLTLYGVTSAKRFHLTIVPEDGSSSYPVSIATVSRGALILSSALEYSSLFTFNDTSGRIFQADSTTTGNGPITAGNVVLFNFYTTLEGSAMERVAISDEVYLVKNGTAADNHYVWWSIPSETGLPVGIEYRGSSSADANAALRVDLQAS
ncbi:hypothetical protein J7T55_006982 [Diaporthe amygdali]|uniref:uncharacterized protein n=1 Tax=Phomopsis amygdali TaxID=1214568 RepID=UPI0022FDFC28|nr:uncharacterized protein J7T55_006982 [Diaporthe amygdali]KAJ0104056.1 hypothetical protein J7T55_006982 [Diaporthe amygdali]